MQGNYFGNISSHPCEYDNRDEKSDFYFTFMNTEKNYFNHSACVTFTIF